MNKTFRLILLSLYAFLLLVFIFSCQQPELEFSCDPVINDFVIENQESLKSATVSDLVSYELPLQRAVFNSWDYEKKRSAWIDKLQQVLSTESFTQAESAHIQKLIGHIHIGYFLEENIEAEAMYPSQFAEEWILYSSNDLGWDDLYIAYLVFRMYTNYSQFEAELSMLKSLETMVSSDSEGSCNCNTSSSFCANAFCYSGGCTTTSGCGWLWSETCDGYCY